MSHENDLFNIDKKHVFVSLIECNRIATRIFCLEVVVRHAPIIFAAPRKNHADFQRKEIFHVIQMAVIEHRSQRGACVYQKPNLRPDVSDVYS